MMGCRGVLVLAVALLASACANDSGLDDVDRSSPPSSITTLVSAPEAVAFTPVDERGRPPQVTLSNGDAVALFEEFRHGNFTNPTAIDNPWLPMVPGTRMVFEGVTFEDGETIPHKLVFTVTDLVKVIDGIPSVVLWDVDYSDGDLVETELAFFAQDDDGNVWRMGEYPEEWEEGELIDAPAWIAGVEDARAGIAMPANPRLGVVSYSQGWGPAVGFTDRAFVWEEGIETCVVTGCYSDVLVTNEFNDDEPQFNQLKYYARGIGNVRVGWRGDDSAYEELELVEIIRLTPEELTVARDAALTLEQRSYILRERIFAPTPPAQRPG